MKAELETLIDHLDEREREILMSRYGLRERETETLEDVFIRLVGRSIEDVERLSDEGVTDDSEE